jgi:CRP-like cAMP-binding protein
MNDKRHGVDRRGQDVSPPTERRAGCDRRNLLVDPDKTIGRLRLFEIFKNLSLDQFKQLLMVCEKKEYGDGEQLFNTGDESTDIFILIDGRVTVSFNDGNDVSNIRPPTIFGEIGVFTGINRTASVEAHGNCTFIILRKKELFRVLITDYELWIKLQSNIIKNLAEKKMTEIISVTESHQNQTIELQ